MERQIILNTVVSHARKQKAQAIIGNNCRYRMPGQTSGGLQCFFGCLIPDDLYKPDMEGRSISNILYEDNIKLFRPILNHLRVEGSNDIDFLDELRIIHDYREPEKWENSFKVFAEIYSLTVPPMEEK